MPSLLDLLRYGSYQVAASNYLGTMNVEQLLCVNSAPPQPASGRLYGGFTC